MRTLTPVTDKQLAREIAIIDLGSNSFHMIIARIINGSFQILSRLKQKVQLAKGLDSEQILSQEAIQRGVDCLALFAQRLQGFETSNVSVIGTYTLRRAVNKQDFLMQASKVFPYPINIISGQEEARLIYAGVSHTQPEKGRKLVIDIGGGSTEMIIGDNFTPLVAESRHMGCVSFAKRFFPNGNISEENFRQAKQNALEKIEDLVWEYQQLGWQNVLGSSGTIKTVHQVLIANGYSDGLITAERLNALIKQTLNATNFIDLQIAGLNENRVDVFVPGLAILSAVFDTFKIDTMRYSNGAIREGVMYNFDLNFRVDNIRERTINALTAQFNLDRVQAQRVAQKASFLAQAFNQWQCSECIDELRQMIHYAAQTHEVGIVINHNELQKHSAYILQHIELPGFDSEQHKLLATIVRFHLGSFNRAEIKPLTRYAQEDVLHCILILRLAVLLNKARQATDCCQLSSFKCQSATAWHIIFPERYLTNNPLIVQDLQQEQKLFSQLGVQLFYQ